MLEEKLEKRVSNLTNNLFNSKSKSLKNIPLDTEQNRQLVKQLFSIAIENNYPLNGTVKNHINSVVSYPTDDYVDRFHALVNWKGNRSETMEYLSLKYGENEAKRRLEEKANRVMGENNPGYQHGGKFSPYSKKFIKGGDYEKRLKEVVEKSSKTKKENPHKNPLRIEYYLAQGMSEKEAKQALVNRQSTFSKEKCIEKYGEKEGLRRWKERQEKWQATLNSKSPEEKARINRAKQRNGSSVSLISQELFESLGIENAKYHNNGGEEVIYIDDLTYYMVDFVLGNKIIEFYGDYWHCNPNRYKPEDIVKFPRDISYKAKEIWQKDKKRKQELEQAGYSVLEIWEGDFKENPDKVIQQCKEFLTIGECK